MTGLALKPKKGSDSNTQTIKRLESLKDDVPRSRTSLALDTDLYRRFKIYLVNEGKTMRDEFEDYMRSKVKDIE